jgi:hypothetical protein
MTTEKAAISSSASSAPMNIATISAGFEKGDFLVREEQGNRVYFDFFEEVSECETFMPVCRVRL